MKLTVLLVYCLCTIILSTDAVSLRRNRPEVPSSESSCSADHYNCDGGRKCIPLKWICDGYNDCQDKLDERNCILTNHTSLEQHRDPVSLFDNPSCERGKFTCDNGAKCLPLTWLCDSIDDCIDKNDEHNCPAKKQGISLAKAAEEAAMMAAQEAKRAAMAADQLMKNANESALKARKAMEIASTSV